MSNIYISCPLKQKKKGQICNPLTGQWINTDDPQYKQLISQGILKPPKEKVSLQPDQSYTFDSFKIKKTLGKGSYGEVYSAKNKSTGKKVVIKKIPKETLTTEDLMEEIEVLNHLKPYCEKYILCYETFFVDDKNTYIITE